MRMFLGRGNRRNLVRILVPLLVWVAIVYVRAHLVGDLRPWELLWVLWVLSTSVAAACVGAMIRDAWRDRPKRSAPAD